MKTTKGSTEKTVEMSAIEKIRKLLEFSVENGATESEVENATKLVQRLMMRHNLELKDVELTSKDINTTIIKSTWKDGMEARSFENQLLTVLGHSFSCKIVITRDRSTNTDSYSVIGLPEDREALVVTFQSIIPQIRVMTKKRFKEDISDLSLFKFTTSYQTGFLVGLREKLNADKETFLKSTDKKEHGLILVKKDTLVTEWMAKNMRIKTGKTKPISLDKGTFEKGVADGSEKGLGKQLGQ